MQLDGLPYEILFFILSRTSPATALKVGTVNKTLQEVTHDDQLWKIFCGNDFPVNSCNYEKPSDWEWKGCYQYFTSMHSHNKRNKC